MLFNGSRISPRMMEQTLVCPHGVEQGPELFSVPNISHPLSGNFLPGRAPRAGASLLHHPPPVFPPSQPPTMPRPPSASRPCPCSACSHGNSPPPCELSSSPPPSPPPQQPTAPAETGADASVSLMPRLTFHFCPLSPPALATTSPPPPLHTPSLLASVYSCCPYPTPHTHFIT